MGNSVPPFFVFPRVYFKDVMLNGAPPGSKGTAHPSGWMTSENFTIFLKHFTDHVKCTVQSPVLLLLDNHDSHISVASIEYAKNNGIVMLTFPPHCSHKLQPLDRSVYGPFKKFYNSACDSWMLENPGRCMTIMDIAGRVGKAFPQAMSPVNIQSGFRVSGIAPFNRDVFTDDEFLSAYVTDRPSAAVPEPDVGLTASTQRADGQDVSPALLVAHSSTAGYPDISLETDGFQQPSSSSAADGEVEPNIQLSTGKNL
jgi:hypothetical protein